MLCRIKNDISLHHVRWYGRCCLNAAEGAGEFTAIKPVGKLAADIFLQQVDEAAFV